jgi:hypothetical protein
MQVHRGCKTPGVENEVAGEVVRAAGGKLGHRAAARRARRTPVSAAFTSRVVPGGGAALGGALAALGDRDDLKPARPVPPPPQA